MPDLSTLVGPDIAVAVPVPLFPAPAPQGRPARPRTPPATTREAGPIDVSVCIANWNCKAMLRDCLESLTEESQGVRQPHLSTGTTSNIGNPQAAQAHS